MFADMFAGWFRNSDSSYGHFIQALIQGDLEAMNYFMNRLCLATFSYFDVSQDEPERFYHGFVLGLMAEQQDSYTLKSNRESGFGRYDVMMIPKQENLPAIIIEFKSKSRMRAETLEEALQAALKQIEEKNYDAELLSLGFSKDRIRHYGFAFEGKKVLIG